MFYLFHSVSVSPLTLYTAMFIVGIIFEKTTPQSFVIFFIISLWMMLLYCLSIYKKEVYLICNCFATTGGWYLNYYQSAWLYNATVLAKQKINLSGLLINSAPSLNNLHKTQYTLYITDSSELSLKKKFIALYLNKSDAIWNPGELIYIKNIYFSIPNHSFSLFLMKEGLSATAHTSKSNIRKLNVQIPIWSYLYTIRFKLLLWSKKLFSPSTYALFSSLFLGYKWNEPIEKNRETFNAFKFWGISHYLARSGMHLAVLIILWYIIISYIPLSWYKKQWILIISSLFYFICTWTSISFLRALISFIFGRIFLCLNEPFIFIHIISLTALSMLIYNPTILFFLDFQLSFGMTFLLAWLTNVSQLRKTLAK